jgi:hypothetical protein
MVRTLFDIIREEKLMSEKSLLMINKLTVILRICLINFAERKLRRNHIAVYAKQIGRRSRLQPRMEIVFHYFIFPFFC